MALHIVFGQEHVGIDVIENEYFFENENENMSSSRAPEIPPHDILIVLLAKPS
jgi:hypothetical protein